MLAVWAHDRSERLDLPKRSLQDRRGLPVYPVPTLEDQSGVDCRHTPSGPIGTISDQRGT